MLRMFALKEEKTTESGRKLHMEDFIICVCQQIFFECKELPTLTWYNVRMVIFMYALIIF
jgi:hypothetical protein